jgi:hypothetical protein
MTLTLARDLDNAEVEAVLDLENGTWTCSEHLVTMDIMSGAECPDCMKSVHAPPDLSALELIS